MITPLRNDFLVQEQLPHGTNYFMLVYGDETKRSVNFPGMWQHMIATQMLEDSSRNAVNTVFPLFMTKWKNPFDFHRVDEAKLEEVIWPLGNISKRKENMKKMNFSFFGWNYTDFHILDGVNDYARESFEIFFKKNFNFKPSYPDLFEYWERVKDIQSNDPLKSHIPLSIMDKLRSGERINGG